MVPQELRYTPEHEWCLLRDRTVRVGITDYAQGALGDIVFVQLPALGEKVSAGQAFGEVESTKSVSDLYAPVSGTVTAVNDSLEGNPELINSAPFEDGWIIEIELDAAADATVELGKLLDGAAYEELIAAG